MSKIILICESLSDHILAHRLAQDLIKAGARVWINGEEFPSADAPMEKLDTEIDERNFLGVILSPDSIDSEFIRREAQTAINKETEGRRINILPLLYGQSEVPDFLKGGTSADFTDDTKYAESLNLVLQRLGISTIAAPHGDEQRLDRLVSSYPLLAAAHTEFQGNVLSKAICSAIHSSTIPPIDISDFWHLLALNAQGLQLFAVALSVLECVDKLGVGHETVEYCLEDERLESYQKDSIAIDMLNMTRISDIVWCHNLITTRIKNDCHYNSFIYKHKSVILTECYGEMMGYLLHPNRGPGNYNIDTFFELVKHTNDPQPLLIRWTDWIRDGYFDGDRGEGGETAEILYGMFNNVLEQESDKLDPLIKETESRTYLLLKRDTGQSRGLYHLVAMLRAKYKRADYVLDNIVPRVNKDSLSLDEMTLYFLICHAFDSLVKLNSNPGDMSLEEEFMDNWPKIAEADITGFFKRAR